MFLIILALLIWYPAIFGLGTTIQSIGKLSGQNHADDAADLALVPIFGLMVIAMAGTLLNFFVPLNATVVYVTVAVGWLLFLINAKKFPLVHTSAQMWLVAGLVLVYTAFLLSKPITHTDSGLYHVQAIRWTMTQPLPAGLANLHGRLGFNTVWFPISAITQARPFSDQAYFLSIGIFYLGYALAIAKTAHQLSLTKNAALSSVYLLVTFGAWLIFAKWSFGTSPAPDFPVTFITLLIVYSLLKAVEAESEQFLYWWGVMILLAVFAISIKLSAIPLLIAPVLAGGWHFWRNGNNWANNLSKALRTRWLVVVLGASVGLMLLWLIRGVVSSGCVAYPIATGCFSGLQWTVPVAQAQNDAAWIQSWGRQPGVPPSEVLGGWQWLIPWLGSLLNHFNFQIAVGLSLAGVTLGWMASAPHLTRVSLLPKLLPAFIVLVSGFIFWFITAPNFRFGEGYWLGIGTLIFSAGIVKVYQSYALTAYNRTLVVVCFIAAFFYAQGPGLINHEELYTHRQEIFLSWPAVPTANTTETHTKQGVSILIPVDDGSCWDSPLPCTPSNSFNENLQVTTAPSGVITQFYFNKY